MIRLRDKEIYDRVVGGLETRKAIGASMGISGSRVTSVYEKTRRALKNGQQLWHAHWSAEIELLCQRQTLEFIRQRYPTRESMIAAITSGEFTYKGADNDWYGRYENIVWEPFRHKVPGLGVRGWRAIKQHFGLTTNESYSPVAIHAAITLLTRAGYEVKKK